MLVRCSKDVSTIDTDVYSGAARGGGPSGNNEVQVITIHSAFSHLDLLCIPFTSWEIVLCMLSSVAKSRWPVLFSPVYTMNYCFITIILSINLAAFFGSIICTVSASSETYVVSDAHSNYNVRTYKHQPILIL